jgi:hypothetical protein
MAFNKSTQPAELLQVVGIYGNVAYGMTTMSSGGGTVTVPQFRTLHGIVGTVQGATGVGETVICTATSGNTATIETISEAGSKTGSSVVMWMAWGEARR